VSLPNENYDVILYYLEEAAFLLVACGAMIVWGMRIELRQDRSFARIAALAVLVPLAASAAMLPAAYLNPWKIANRLETAKLNKELRQTVESRFQIKLTTDCYSNDANVLAVATKCGDTNEAELSLFDRQGRKLLSVNSEEMAKKAAEVDSTLPKDLKFAGLTLGHTEYQLYRNKRTYTEKPDLDIQLQLRLTDGNRKEYLFKLTYNGHNLSYTEIYRKMAQ
jgi:hypothetical protein